MIKKQTNLECRAILLTLIAAVSMTASAPTVVAQRSHADEGFTEPSKSIVVASPESGVLTTVEVNEGEHVQAGAVLARLDSQVLQASVNAAKQRLEANGKIKAAQASLDNKSNRLKQMQELFRNEHASDKEVQQAQLEFDIAQANLESQQDENRLQEMELKKIQAQLERRIVRSPITGIVLELPHKVGEAITASDSTVATVVALDQLRIRYFLTTRQAISMKRGDQVKIAFPDTAQSAIAEVDFISPVTDSNSGTVRVEMLIDNNDGQYRSGLRCTLDHPRILRNAPATTSNSDVGNWLIRNADSHDRPSTKRPQKRH
jgi:RND family efflux transporter MFP subunit